MIREDKQKMVEELKGIFLQSSLFVVLRQDGLSVSEITDLRSRMRASAVSLRVVKNTLARIALEEASFADLKERIAGPTAIAYGDDPVSAAKVAMGYAKDNEKLSVVAGVLDGAILSKEEVVRLSQLPSLDELRGKIVGVLAAPAGKLVRTLNEPASQLARVLSAYGRK